MQRALTLGEVITRLRKEDPARRVQRGFGWPHSYRLQPNELGFEPEKDVTIGRMLAVAESALGAFYRTQEGGVVRIKDRTPCHLAFSDEGLDGVDRLSVGVLNNLIEGGDTTPQIAPPPWLEYVDDVFRQVDAHLDEDADVILAVQYGDGGHEYLSDRDLGVRVVSLDLTHQELLDESDRPFIEEMALTVMDELSGLSRGSRIKKHATSLLQEALRRVGSDLDLDTLGKVESVGSDLSL